MASYSIRSASVEKEEELKGVMQSIVDKFNQKYKGLAEAQIEFEIHLLPFEKAEDDRIERVHTEACKKPVFKMLLNHSTLVLKLIYTAIIKMQMANFLCRCS